MSGHAVAPAAVRGPASELKAVPFLRLAYGMVLLNSAAAIVLSFALPIVFAVVFAWEKITSAAPWLDPSTAQDPLTSHHVTAEDWRHLAVNTLIWVVIPMAFGVWRLLRSEVKSA